MITILFIIFIGKYYYELAQSYFKHRWLYFLLGISTYYFSSYLLINAISWAYAMYWVDYQLSTYDILKIQFLFGPLCAIILYWFLNFKWKREAKRKNEIDEIGKRSQR